MLVLIVQNCECTCEEKLGQLADEVRKVKKIVKEIQEFVHQLPHQTSLTFQQTCESNCKPPPPLPSPVLPQLLPAVLHVPQLQPFVPGSSVPRPTNLPAHLTIPHPSSPEPHIAWLRSPPHHSTPCTLSTSVPASQPSPSVNAGIASSGTALSATPPLPSGAYLTCLVNEVQLQSCSRRNFCANMVWHLFSMEECRSSNVKGRQGKRLLDPVRVSLVQRSAMETYPLAGGEKENVVWRQCVKAIHEACRRLNRVLAKAC